MLNDKELEEIRRKLLELDEEPPGDGWQNIRDRIRPRRRRRLLWWFLPLGLLLTTGGGWLLVNVASRQQPVAARTTGPAPNRRAESLPNSPAPAAPGKAVPGKPVPPDRGKSPSADPGKALPPDPNKAPSADPDRAVPADSRKVVSTDRDKALPTGPDKAFPAEPGKSRSGARPLPAEAVAGNRPPSGTRSDPVAPSTGGADRPGTLSGTKPGAPGQPSESRPGNRRYRRQTAPAGQARMARTTKRRPGGLAVVSGPANPRAVAPVNGETDEAPRDRKPVDAELAALTPLRSRSIVPGTWRVTGQPFSFNGLPTRSADSSGREPADDKIRVREPRKPGGWTVGAFAAPRYSFRRFAPVGSDDVYITRLNRRNASNTQRMGYEAGLSVGRLVTPRLALRTSLAYTRLNENLSYAYTTGRVDTVLRSLTSDNEILVNPVLQTGERQLISSYAYAGWRAGATWYFAQRARRRYHLSLDGGVNLLVKGRTKTLLNGPWQETVYFPSRDNLLEQTNYNLQVGIGCSFRAGRGYEFTVMPALNYFLGSTFRSREPFGLRPYSLGIHLQLSRWLGREP